MAFSNVADIATSRTDGRTFRGPIRKLPSQASTAGWWVDLSMASGTPNPNYYASTPLVAKRLDGDDGIRTGGSVSPAVKIVTSWGLCTPTAGLVGTYWLLDYLLTYPFIDLDTVDQQDMIQTDSLSRYTDGEGVQAMLVAVTPTVGGGTFEFDYVNQDGDSKTSPVQSFSTAAASIASLPCSQQATAAGGRPFLRLADSDTGIRSLTAWRTLTVHGGLGAVVLVRPLAEHAVREINSWSVQEWPQMGYAMPVVQDGAYLNMIMNCAATVASGTLAGFVQSVWK